ncbi:holo-ACP synthase [Aeromicrobium sp. CTD01-1L150]|uniref:holo-ACP synthase AcpS n=1 Tax=Aeromicrobium sp. CTD01-1L150 TaxID=3341830 RepID=UPI0035C0D431
MGTDLVHVPSFAEQLQRPGTRFAQVFTPGERRDAADRPASLAVRWAAKEALVKAWSASLFGSPPLMGDEALGQVEVVRDAWDRPRLRLHGDVAKHLSGVEAHVSLSHDADHAIAYVVLSTEPAS